ncbi:phage minor capsid protein, partial [Herbiconiux daphne]
WAEKGIPSGFVDKAGRRWNIQTYAKASIKSTVNDVRNEVRRERLNEYGIHTVIVTSHPSARPACSHIQGHVVDLRRPEAIPEGSKYKSIYDPSWNAHYQEPSGHMGVNCHHMHIPFDPDVNENNQVKYKPEDVVKRFEKEQGQRALENRIRKTKTKMMIAKELGNTSELKRLSRVVAKQRKTMVQYTRANELRRKPKREQVRIPVKTLMGD